MTDHDDRNARLRRFFAAVEAMRPNGPAALEQLRAGLDHISVSVLRTKESPMPLPSPLLYTAEHGRLMLDQLRSEALRGRPAHLPVRRDVGVFTSGGVLAPPIVDPTRRPRRTDGPRLRVRAVDGHKITLPAADARNLMGSREPLLFVAEWEIWLIDEDGREQMLEHHGTGAGALHALPRLMRQLGLLNDDGTRPSAESGVSNAA